MNNRRIDLFYSEEDEGYIARQADQHGISAFGETPEDALRELRVVFSMIDTPTTKELVDEIGRRAASVPGDIIRVVRMRGDMADILCDVIIGPSDLSHKGVTSNAS